MATADEKLEAIEYRMDEAAHYLRRMIELGQLTADEGLAELTRRYARDAYESAKAGLAACLAKLDEPSSAVGLDQVQGFAIATEGEQLNRRLGYLNDLVRGLRWAPVRRQEGEAVVEWSNEQKEALRQEITAALQAARDLLAAMP